MGLNSAKNYHPIFTYIQSRARVLAVLSLLGLLLTLASPLIPHTSGTWAETLAWLIDLGTHWQWLYLGGLLLFGALAALGDRRWAIILLTAPLALAHCLTQCASGEWHWGITDIDER